MSKVNKEVSKAAFILGILRCIIFYSLLQGFDGLFYETYTTAGITMFFAIAFLANNYSDPYIKLIDEANKKKDNTKRT